MRVTKDKVFRARLSASRAQAGLLSADQRAPWWPAFATELPRFPRGQHDDQSDALAGLVARAVTAPANEKLVKLTFGAGY